VQHGVMTDVEGADQVCYLLQLPPELLLFILTRCGLRARDLVQLDRTCTVFYCARENGGVKTSVNDSSLTEAAAKTVIQKFRSKRLQSLEACEGYSWKHKLQILEYLEVASPCLATGSYQNLFVNQLGYIQ
jgi:hypothetical protein